MSESLIPEGSKQSIFSALPEQPATTREVRQFPIKVDSKEVRYPEDYPFSFIADGAPAAIRQIMGGMSSDTKELRHAIDTYLRPSQEIFTNTNNLPDWYQEILGPVIEKNHITLDNMKPADIHILGDDFRWALEDIYNFPFPKQLQISAARSMGQTEGTVPTLSALITQLKEKDPEQLERLLETLLKRGPDGFAMAAYLAAPEEEKAVKSEKTEPEFDLSKVVKRDETGRAHIDHQATKRLIDTSFQSLREGYNREAQDISPKSYISWGPHGEPYRMRLIQDSTNPESQNTFYGINRLNDTWQGIKHDETGRSQDTQQYIEPAQALKSLEYPSTSHLSTKDLSEIADAFTQYATQLSRGNMKGFFTPDEIMEIIKDSHIVLERLNQFPRGTFAEANYVRLLHSPSEIKEKINQTSQPHVETTDWYTSRMIPAIQRIIDKGLYKQVYMFKPTSAEQVITEDELEHGLRMLFHLDLPAGSVRVVGKDFTLGNILKQQAKKDPREFEKSLAMLMATGYEGYTIAETLAKYVSGIDIPTSYAYGKIEHPEYYRLPQQKDIPPALLTLLDFPLPKLRRAASVGGLLKGLSNEQKQQLLSNAKGIVGRFVAFEATHVEKAA